MYPRLLDSLTLLWNYLKMTASWFLGIVKVIGMQANLQRKILAAIFYPWRYFFGRHKSRVTWETLLTSRLDRGNRISRHGFKVLFNNADFQKKILLIVLQMFFMKSIVNHKRKDSFGRRSLSFFLGRKLGNRFLKQISVLQQKNRKENMKSY